jgi:hypothetical protein
MTKERMDEIITNVIYKNLNTLPKMKDNMDAFYVGKLIGLMEKQLEIELEMEVEEEEDEDDDEDVDFGY